MLTKAWPVLKASFVLNKINLTSLLRLLLVSTAAQSLILWSQSQLYLINNQNLIP